MINLVGGRISGYRHTPVPIIVPPTREALFIDTSKFNDYMRFLRFFFEKDMTGYGFTPREKQIELAEEIFAALNDRSVFLGEAAVGTGKTLAYLLPSVLIRRGRINEGKFGVRLPDGHQMPVVIATASIALQKALITDYIPLLSKILMERKIIKKPLTAALRKGKSHYVCDRRFNAFMKTANMPTRTAAAALRNRNIVDLSELKELTPYIKRGINVDEHCNRDCTQYGYCRYTRFLQSVNKGGYDFQVINHNLFLADIMLRAHNGKPLIPDYQAVVIDEAHKFIDASRDMYCSRLTLDEISNAARDIGSFTLAPGQKTFELRRLAKRVDSKSRLLFQFLNQAVPDDEIGNDEVERYTTKISGRADKLLRDLKKDVDVLVDVMPGIAVTSKFKERHKRVTRTVTDIDDTLSAFMRHRDLVYWLENTEIPVLDTPAGVRAPALGILQGMPKNLGSLLYKDLWAKEFPMILISGTLSAAGSFEHIQKKTGLDMVPAKRLVETSKPSPFDYRKNVMLYVSEDIPFPDNTDPAYIDAVTSETERLIGAANGHTAVLFTSYKAMELVHERVKEHDLPFPIFRLDRGGTAALDQFKKSGNGVLFASGQLWEGIDIPGDILSMLIIVRLPFAVPDPLSNWEKTMYTDIDEYIEKVIVPEMLVKLRQGFGRLIRSEWDSGVVAILDCRAGKRGSYRKEVLAAFPPCLITSSIKMVSKFFRKVKSAVYFT